MSVSLVRSLLSGQERFAVTGASGWLGRTALELFEDAYGPGLAEHVVGYASAAKAIRLRSGSVVNLRSLDRLPEMDPGPTHILHFAYLTRDQVGLVGLDTFARTNLAITATVVAALEDLRPQGVLTASSGAVYEGGGRLATNLATNPYGTLKHLEELAIRRAAHDVAANSVVVRIFSVTGPYISKPELYALGDLVLQALAGGPLVVRSNRPVVRRYCAAADVVALGLSVLLGSEEGTGDTLFDSGGDLIEVGELANQVRAALELPHLGIERSWDPDLPADSYAGDGFEMEAMAAYHGLQLRDLRDQIRETASYLGDHHSTASGPDSRTLYSDP